MSVTYELLLGIDWASEAHQICLVTPEGRRLEELTVEHNAEAIHAFVDRVLKRVNGDAERVAVAIEVPRGPLVETLLERGLHVYTLNPKQVDRFRDRHTPAGAKDDRLDAYVLGDALRTDLHNFRQISVDHRLVIQIREVSRAEEDLRAESNRLANRLRDQIYRWAPHLLVLSAAANEPWFWNLVEQVVSKPSKRLTRTWVEKLLRRHRIRRHTSDDVLRTLSAKQLSVAPGVAEAARTHILLLLPRLRIVQEQRKTCAKHLEELLDAYAEEVDGRGDSNEGPSDVEILRSAPGIGSNVTATLLAEAARPLQEHDYSVLRALGGIAPVTKRSGKSHVVLMRYGCNMRLRNAFYHWARTSIQRDETARAYYQTLRTRGHSHGRALRSVADRWLRILTAMLKHRTLYSPQHQRPALAAA